ncbi:sensor histidine kinase [Sporosarcina gallistercoris]|uniref:histidine kinase n=1 Tax=Sporosarcina gallistercoris TaxID=2762245 RepID=A0ABR8PK78_9BACL|nr:sensor histidine kinase [Sporosarcina gallistercoris]MBD7908577.1 sensor histidine kinase [Sporosarcina gallistercoris]
MVRAYLADKKSWIALFAGSLLLTDLLLVLDKGLAISSVSIGYLNVLLLVIFVLFFIWRYRKETAYLQALTRLVNELPSDWQEGLPMPVFHQEKILTELFREVDGSYRSRMARLREFVHAEQNDTAAWVHEVKAPLTAMKLVIDANRQEPVFRKIETEWLRIHLLIDQQLYISRLPSLEADYVVEETDVVRLAADEVRQLMPWCLEKNIAVEIEGEQVAVVTDQKWCRFILRQLLTNAVKYSPAGGTVTIKAEVGEAGYVSLIVADEGPGIQAHEMPRIFDRGFTGNAGRIQHAATGLGLYLAKQTAEKIGVRLHGQSDGTTGTHMVMTFPTENDFDATRK